MQRFISLLMFFPIFLVEPALARRALSRNEVIQIQTTLCLEPDGVWGTKTPTAFEAFRQLTDPAPGPDDAVASLLDVEAEVAADICAERWLAERYSSDVWKGLFNPQSQGVTAAFGLTPGLVAVSHASDWAIYDLELGETLDWGGHGPAP